MRNPCSFPIEFYSLEFDNGYLEEEKVLRLMRGYDEYSTLLLPPRPINEKLPGELMDFYEGEFFRGFCCCYCCCCCCFVWVVFILI